MVSNAPASLVKKILFKDIQKSMSDGKHMCNLKMVTLNGDKLVAKYVSTIGLSCHECSMVSLGFSGKNNSYHIWKNGTEEMVDKSNLMAFISNNPELSFTLSFISDQKGGKRKMSKKTKKSKK
jgi:hypothetical protein